MLGTNVATVQCNSLASTFIGNSCSCMLMLGTSKHWYDYPVAAIGVLERCHKLTARPRAGDQHFGV